ncbi:FadR/GntR family transcriptional regulator [Peribacillus sp. NPDC096379]|uniref:FadR/GntR family transcriptional regulator n=1 Tax=Peribacillus sp. NPDC096379 TaxID=3364393 RepID=UPI000783E773
MIKKTKRLTLVEQVAIQIEDLIEAGQWEVGSKLPAEPELMAKFDVSRNTLREAIRALVHAGLLETRQGIGTTVKSSSNLGIALERKIQKSDLIETLEVRLALEKEAAQLAAERRSNEDLKRIEECLEKCIEAAKDKEPQHFIDMDIAFHKSVVKATHNQMFIELYDHITDSLQSSIRDIMSVRGSLNDEYEVHSDLYEAIRLQDTQLAIKSVNAYVKKANDSLFTVMEGKN